MNIIIFGTLSGKGGVQRIVYWLAKTFVDSNCNVLVISSGMPETCGVNKISQHDRLKVVFLKELVGREQEFIFKEIDVFIRLTKLAYEFKPNVYLGIGTGWNLSLLSLVLPRHIRSIFFEVVSGVPSGWQDPRWGVKLWFDEVVGISPRIAQTFVECFGWKKSTRAIPGFAEPLEMTASLPQIKLKTIAVGKAKAAFFGRLVPHKQAFWLIQQWSLLKAWLGELHIHGTGPEEKSIRDYIELHELSDRVKCFGSYPSEGQAYADLISSYDLTLLPTLGNEGTPLVLMESMACGVPFIAYGVNGIPDYGVDNPNVLIVQPEPSAFIAGVKQMAHRLSKGQINQAQLHQFYMERYSYAVLKKAWLSYLSAH